MAKFKWEYGRYRGPSYSNKMVTGTKVVDGTAMVELYCTYCGTYDIRDPTTIDTEDVCRHCKLPNELTEEQEAEVAVRLLLNKIMYSPME